MYTGATFDSSGQFYSLLYESLTYLGGWQGVGISISERLSYRNHYMCSGEATSEILIQFNLLDLIEIFCLWKLQGGCE